MEGCTGIRRTTGQHPGGIIVLPFGEDINSFTPVQHPANDMTTDIITTHFDYHSIDANLLKLDILGHDDPTMIRMLEDITHLDAQTIPLDNPEVMSLFKSTEALGIKPEDIGGCPLGCLGVPEFGTDFVIQMLLDTKPQSFSDLIRISGLSHGTDVWLGNAQTLIEEGKATISTAICTRDDIMIYLIDKGLESELSFTIMESVRKGKGLKPEWEEEMKAHDVPDWYIWSCKKIKYMFPKAHAAAYVMMAYRIAYYKIFYPLAYYAAYFSIRASAFSYELMCMGRDRLEYYMKDYEKRKDTLTQKEQATVKDMKIVQEMYARGLEFMPIDIYRAKAKMFQIIDGKLMPSLASIEGMGDKAAEAVEEASKDGPYLSLDDFRIIRDQLFGDKKRDIGDRDPVQYAVFIDPPLAHIGISEEEALKRGYSFKVSRLPATSIVRTRTLQQTDGMLKAIINNHNGKIMGCTLFCADASEIINIVAMAIKTGQTSTFLRDFIFTHPSMSEGLNQLFDV